MQYWVSPSGSDTSTGLSQATAFKTLQHAELVTNPGDVVNVLPGTYTATAAHDVLQINRGGTAGAWITYKAAPGAKIQVSPNNWMGVDVLAPYIIVQGFEIIGNARNVTMDFALQHAKDGTIPQTNSYGVAIGSHHVQILNNTIHDNSGHGIGGGGDYVTIAGNDVYGNGNWSPYATGGVSQVQLGTQQFDNASGYHNYIINNRIHDNVELIGNLAANGAITDGNGIIVDSNQFGFGSTPYTGRTLIGNNVLTNNGAAGVHVFQSAHVDVVSNVSVNNNLNVKEGEIEAARSSDVNMSSNIMIARSGSYATGGYSDTNVTYDYNFVAGPATFNATPHGPHDILANALFSAFGSWTAIGAVRTSSGYEIALKNGGTGQYTVWTTDSNGNYGGSPIGVVSGNSYALESLELTFNQDLNGDGLIGPPTTVTVIQTDTNSFGSTSLVKIGNNYFLFAAGGTTGPELQYNGATVMSGMFGSWNPIGAVQTASGYEIAWKDASRGLYTVWSTDSNGNYFANLIGSVPGNSQALEALETTFNQDLNGDGIVGLITKAIQVDGATSLTEIGANFFLSQNGSGPELKYAGSPVTDGEFGSWTPISAVQTASGYEIAWKDASRGLYTVWSTDSSGNYLANLIGSMPGNSQALEAIETTFNQDLNGDGTVGLITKVIQVNGATSLTEIGPNFFLSQNGSGPELKYAGSPVTDGEFGSWTPISAVQTASGYEIAWKDASRGLYTVWSTDSSGNYLANLIGSVSGNTQALEGQEPIFGQDLNADHVLGLYAAPGAMLQINHTMTGSSGAATIGAGATLELAAADSATVTFAAASGMLKLDQPSTFSGAIFGFTGDGTLAGSDQIDLKGINFGTAHGSYTNGVLTVADGAHSATLNFHGSYTLANFKFADDGNGGTIVYDPPAAGPSQGGTVHVSTDASNDAFAFHPSRGFFPGSPQEGTTQTHQENGEGAASATVHKAHENIAFGEVPHDVPAIHDAALAQMHHVHLLV